MKDSLTFGLFDWVDDARKSIGDLYESRLKLIELADAAGFYGYHLAEHHGTPLGMAPSPAVFLASVSQRTKRIRFSPMAFLLPMYHPVRLVEEICMLDHLSKGRVEVGISRGVSPYELKCFDIDPEVSGEMFTEVLEIFRLAMCEEVLDYSGKHYRFEDVPMEIKPYQKPYPPLWYPSFSESGVEYAATNGLNFMSIGPPDLTKHLTARYWEVSGSISNNIQRLNQHVKAPKVGAMRQIYIDETQDDAMAVAESAYADFYQSITQLWHRRSDSSYDQFFNWGNCISAETVLVGSVDQVLDKIQTLIERTGINYFVGSFAWGSLKHEESERSLELFINEIMPELSQG